MPFIIGVFTILPLCPVAWMYGWLTSGRCTWREIARLKFRDPVIQHQRFGAGHLWFLEYLLVMLAVYALVRWWIDRRGDGPAGSRPCARRFARHGDRYFWRCRRLPFLDQPSRAGSRCRTRSPDFIFDSSRSKCFITEHFSWSEGAIRLRHELERFSRTAVSYLALSVPVFLARASLVRRDWETPLKGVESLEMAALGALFAWLMVFGLIGLALRLYRTPHRSVRYLADSSYWIYLIHMPILGFIQVDLFRVPGTALWKFPLVLTGTLALGFASYETLVRYTAIGKGLHGHRERPSAAKGHLFTTNSPMSANSASNDRTRSA